MSICHANPQIRFVRRGNAFQWCHALEMRPGDLDCSDMTEAEFEAEVCRALGIFNFCWAFA